MRSLIAVAAFALFAAPVAADAGCLTGAAVGGVAGHVMGHGVAGAAAGCAIGHHHAKVSQRQNSGATNTSGSSDQTTTH